MKEAIIIFLFTIIISFSALVIWGRIINTKNNKLEHEKQILKRVEAEAVKRGVGEYVADTNGYPVFKWKTENKDVH